MVMSRQQQKIFHLVGRVKIFRVDPQAPSGPGGKGSDPLRAAAPQTGAHDPMDLAGFSMFFGSDLERFCRISADFAESIRIE